MKGKSYGAIAILLAMLVLFTTIPFGVLAQSTEDEHIFTYEELACMDYEPIENNASRTDNQLVPIGKTENSTKGTTTYYIIECADGYMLTSPTSSTFSRTRYSAGNSDSHVHQKWSFNIDGAGNLRVATCHTAIAMLLTVNPETKAVTLGMYNSASAYQTWKMYYSSNGNALQCVSSDSRVNGYRLVINGSSLSVSNTTYTPIGFFDVDWYTPVTSLSYPGFYIAVNQSKYISPTKMPSNAHCTNTWINWSTGSSSKLSVQNSGQVTGQSVGSTTLIFRDKITRVAGTCTVKIVESGTVGILTIFSAFGSEPSSWTVDGHSFLSFLNISNSAITIGCLKVNAGAEITFGTYSETALSGISGISGIIYNYDAYRINSTNDFGYWVTLSENVSSTDVENINTDIANHDEWWAFYNCSSFAKEVWNHVSSTELSAGAPNTPYSLMNSIKEQSGYEINRAVQNMTPIGYVNNGNFVSFDPEDIRSFANPVAEQIQNHNLLQDELAA